MEITRRPDLETFYLDEMKATFAKEERTTDEIHVSDLLALRKAYWSRVRPRPLTDDEVGYFVAGRGHEDAVGRVSGIERGAPREVEGILLRPDFQGSIPLEFKTRRRKLAENEVDAAERYETYLDQCRSYAALLNRPAAWLWVLGLVQTQDDGSTKPEFQVWHVDFTPEELAAQLAVLRTRRDKLALAWRAVAQLRDEPDRLDLEQDLAATLDLCPAWQCGKASTTFEPWTCETCDKPGTGPHCITCHRYFEGDWGATRHVNSKLGAGHETVAGKTRTEFKPRCRWFTDCQPWKDDPRRGPSDPEAWLAAGVPGNGGDVGADPGATEPHGAGGVAGEPGAQLGGRPGGDPGGPDAWDF